MANMNGTVCTAEEQALMTSSNKTALMCLTRGQSIGLTLSAEAGFISLVAVMGVLILIFSRVFRGRKLISRPMDVYMIALFIFDIFFALGRVTDVKWINEGKLGVGPYCTAQGVLQQTGETGVAMITIVIALHTLIVVLWGKLKDRLLLAYAVVAIIWLFLILFIGITVGINTHGSQYYETPTPYWCWIGDRNKYNAERYAGEYVWMWLALGVSILSYVPLFFWARGNLIVSKTHWYKIEFHKYEDTRMNDPDGRKRRSVGMIAYPLLYAVLVLPISCTRWISGFGYSDKHVVPSAAVFFAEFLYSSSGYLNVLLFLFTRSDLLSIGDRARTGKSRHHIGLAPGVKLSGSPEPSRFSDAGSYISSPGGASRLKHRGEEPAPVGLLPGSEDDGGWVLPNMEDDGAKEV